MKVCISELLKKVKDYESQVNELQAARNKDARITYIQGEEPIKPEKTFVEYTDKIRTIQDKIMNLRWIIADTNLITVSEDNNDLSLAEMIVSLGQVSSELRYFEMFSKLKPKDRKTTFQNTVEYTEITYDLNDVKKQYDELKALKTKLQMEIDRLNLNTFIEIDDYLMN